MTRDGGRAGTVEPEGLAGLGADRNKPLARAAVGETDHLTGRVRNRVTIIANDIANQNHLGQAAPLALGGITNGPQIALIEVFKPREQHSRASGRIGFGGQPLKIVLDFNNGRHCVAGLSKKLETDRPHMRWHPMQDPAC